MAYNTKGTPSLNVARLRSRLGMTQAQLAELMGVSVKTVSNWENGAPIRRISLARLEELANEGQVDANESESRFRDLEARVDYLERIVLRMRSDALQGRPAYDDEITPPAPGDYGLAAKRAKRERAFDDQSPEGGDDFEGA